MAGMEEIEAIFLGERNRWDQTIIGTAQLREAVEKAGNDPLAAMQTITIKGPAEPDELTLHLSYRFYGRWKTHPKYGKQFAFDTAIRAQPFGRAGVQKYLMEAPHIGLSIAQKLWDKFQSDAVRIVREQPEVASVAVGGAYSIAKAEESARFLQGVQRLEGCTIELTDLLTGHGFFRTTIKHALGKFGNKAAELVKKNPYLLMAFRGCGFAKCDKLYQTMGLPLDSIKRQCFAGWYGLTENREGHTWFPVVEWEKSIERKVASAKIKFQDAMIRSRRAKLIDTYRDDRNEIWVAEYAKAEHERRIAGYLSEAIEEPTQWPSIDDLDLGDEGEHQHEQLAKAMAGPIGLLIGSPGTGKSFTAAALTKRLVALVGVDEIAVMAPTGKAAVRLTEAMSGYQLTLQATTIHRRLKVAQGKGDDTEFAYGEGNPLPQKYWIVDECFLPGSPVETPRGLVAIEQLRPGDEITNAIGTDRVVAVCKKEATAVTRSRIGGAEIFSSEGHRFLTRRGWVRAADLKPGDSVVQTAGAMRLLRKGIHSGQRSETAEILLGLLRREVVVPAAELQSQGVHQGEGSEVWGRQEAMASCGESRSECSNRANPKAQSSQPAGSAQENQPHAACNGLATFTSGREGARMHEAAGASFRDASCRMGYGACSQDGVGEGSGESFHDRHCQPGEKACNRNRRTVPQFECSPVEGCEEGLLSYFVRVDSVEVLESSDPQLDRFRDAQGKLYFYDLQAARHRTYSVAGLCVHNCSMLSADLMASLLAARARGTHVLFVGDPNQLAPVGHGAPLRDMIAAGLPCGELRKIRRNAGRIVHACAQIRDGEEFSMSAAIDLEAEEPENLKLLRAANPEEQIRKTLAALKAAQEQDGQHPVWDCQVLVPINKGSKVCRKEINRILQRELNPNGETAGTSPFRKGDKIICLKNGFYPVDDRDPCIAERTEDQKVFVANGEMGRVLAVASNLTTVRLSAPDRVIKIPRGEATSPTKAATGNEGSIRQLGDEDDADDTGTGCQWDLAYAISVHKSQGSEFPVVIFILDESNGARRICSRELIYTGISRAKRVCLLVGKKGTADAFCRRVALDKRKTFLTERLMAKTYTAA